MKKAVLLNVIIPIMLGGVIYYIFTPEVIFVERIDEVLGLNCHIEISSMNFVWQFVRNYFLDMLWGYALVFALFYIFDNGAAKLVAVFIISFMTSCIIEMLQLFSIARGTFDLWDITWMLFAELVAVFVIKKIILGRKHP